MQASENSKPVKPTVSIVLLITFLCGTVEHGSKITRISGIDKFCMSSISGLQKAVTPLLVSMFHDAYHHCRKRRAHKSARQGCRSIQIACRCQRRCNDLARKALNDMLARNRVAP